MSANSYSTSMAAIRNQVERHKEQSGPRPGDGRRLMNTLYTLGYQGKKIEEIEEKVRELGALLLDVRLIAWARDPDFRKDALIRRFGESYWHCDLFGNLNYMTGGPIKIKDGKSALHILKFVLPQMPVILLCGCWNVEECHRKLIAEKAAQAFGAEVEHLVPRSPRKRKPEPQLALL